MTTLVVDEAAAGAKAAVRELLEVGARQECALKARDVEEALRLGELRDAACRRLRTALDGRPVDGDLAGGLREARAANLRSLRLARSLAREIRGEIESMDAAGPGPIRPTVEARVEPRFVDRRG